MVTGVCELHCRSTCVLRRDELTPHGMSAPAPRRIRGYQSFSPLRYQDQSVTVDATQGDGQLIVVSNAGLRVENVMYPLLDGEVTYIVGHDGSVTVNGEKLTGQRVPRRVQIEEM